MNNEAYFAGYMAKAAEEIGEQQAATIAVPSAATTTHHSQQDPYGSPGDSTKNAIPSEKKPAKKPVGTEAAPSKNLVKGLWSNQ